MIKPKILRRKEDGYTMKLVGRTAVSRRVVYIGCSSCDPLEALLGDRYMCSRKAKPQAHARGKK